MERLWRWFERRVAPFSPDYETEPPPRGIFRFIAYYTRGLWRFLLVVGVLNALIAAGEALFFVWMGLIVDWTAQGRPDTFLQNYAAALGKMLLLGGVILPLATILHSLILHQTVSANYPMRVRWQVHQYMLSQSMAFFSDEFAGRVANKVMQTAMAVRTAVLKLLDVMVHLAVYIITMMWMLAAADPWLCSVLGGWLLCYGGTVSFCLPRLRRLSQRQADARSDMVGRIVDSYVNISTVKLFGGKGREAKFAKEAMRRFIGTEYRGLRMLTLFDVSVQLLNYALLIGATTLALYLWAEGAVTPGAIAVTVAVAIRMINMSRWMMWEVGVLFENIGTVYDGMQTISRPLAVKDRPQPATLPRCRGEVCFRDVTFGYGTGPNVITGVSLHVDPGEKVGLVGPSGAGKTTLVNLLLRFYDVRSGSITLDGYDIRDLRQDDLHDCFAMVAQEPSLLHLTVGENICYGGKYDTAAMIRAAKLTEALPFIENLSDYRGGCGFDTQVGERGIKLSGGQRQRIALARVVLRDAPILILDEATSALDAESEEAVSRNLTEVMRGRTVIAIAHRIATLRQMDRLIVLEHGRVVETGSMSELRAAGGLFARLWQAQTDGFLKG